MPLSDRDKLNRIEELKGKLFSKNYETRIEHRDNFAHLSNQEVSDSWEVKDKESASGEKFFMKTSVFKNSFIFSLVFFILALLYGSYMFFAGGNTVSNDNIDISILGNAFTAGGEELSLVLGITNKNTSALELADLVMEYPKSSSISGTDSASDAERIRLSLGSIPSGSLRNENLKVVLFGEQGSIIPIKFSLEYRVEGSNAIFVKEKLYEVTLSSTPINLSVDAPLSISPNQNITLNVRATLNATKSAPKILVKVDYPTGFQFISSSPPPSFGNNVWNLGDIAPGAEHNISISGSMIDVVDSEEKTFRVWSGSQSKADKSMVDVVFNSLSHTVTIKKAFIETNLFVNGVGAREYAVDAKTAVNGEIRFVNNLDTKVNDVEIRAKILGNAVNRKTISAQQGFYNSSSDVIVWDKNSFSQLAEVNPGESGSVAFSLSPLSLFTSGGGILQSPSITVEINISGKQLLEGYATEELKNFESVIIRIISDVGFANKALYYSGPFANTGPIPPKVEKETTYTIVWSLSNTSNNISKGVVRSTVPSWVRFVGTTSPSSEDLTYNASTKEIFWNIGKIPKGTGITEGSKEVAFKVAFSPSLSQLRTSPTIINEAVLTGHDDFANVDIRVAKNALNIALNSDPLFPINGGTVAE